MLDTSLLLPPPRTATSPPPHPPAQLSLHPSLFPLCPFTHTNTHAVDYLAIERGGRGDKVSMLREGGNMWDGEEIRWDTNREGQRACRKQRLISQMTHAWMVCLMLNLQLQQKSEEPIITNLTAFLTISVHFICSLSVCTRLKLTTPFPRTKLTLKSLFTLGLPLRLLPYQPVTPHVVFTRSSAVHQEHSGLPVTCDEDW